MSHHRRPRPSTTATHPSGRHGAARRPFGDPIAFEDDHARFIPPPLTNRVNLTLPLAAIMPTDWIIQAGKIVFHTVGDTGGIHGIEVQEAVADRMEQQVNAAANAEKPAF